MAQRLSAEEINQRLKPLPDWSLVGDRIEKRFTFAAFMEAIGFVNRVAQRAEEADHHPEITINYRKVLIQLSTHSAGGLTSKDFELARTIDAAAETPG